uniref:BAR/IMD domain containing adaptor protein 2 like 2b n=1 Tax=Astyanax mexicanus TaxID=7994 RepID=A0A8B9JE98_ASTMX
CYVQHVCVDMCVYVYMCVFQNLMEQFNPGLQTLVTLGNNYVKAFQGESLRACSPVSDHNDNVFKVLSGRIIFSEGSGEYMQYLRQSQHEILREEERRYRFLAEKHCGLTHTLLFLINKSMIGGDSGGWSLNGLDTPTYVYCFVFHLSLSFYILLCLFVSAPSPLPSRSRSSSVGESLGLVGGRTMRALVSHPASSNPVLLPFSNGETLTVLIPEPRNGWLYGRHDASLASADLRPISPAPDRKTEASYETKATQKTYSEIPPPAPPIRRASGDFRPVSPLIDRRAESHFDSKVEHKGYSQIPPPAPPLPNSLDCSVLMFVLFRFRGSNPFATVKLRPTVTNDRSAPKIH